MRAHMCSLVLAHARSYADVADDDVLARACERAAWRECDQTCARKRVSRGRRCMRRTPPMRQGNRWASGRRWRIRLGSARGARSRMSKSVQLCSAYVKKERDLLIWPCTTVQLEANLRKLERASARARKSACAHYSHHADEPSPQNRSALLGQIAVTQVFSGLAQLV